MLLIYKSDNKVTLTEQDIFEEFIEALEWTSSVNIQSFVSHTGGLVNQYISQSRESELLENILVGLSYNPNRAFHLAKKMIYADDIATEEELDILTCLSKHLKITTTN